jgi:hypothetical protein
MNKQAILDTLRKFARQRPGLDFGNYGDVSAYRSELRAITRDLAHAQTLLKAVEWQDGIDANDLIGAALGAFSGRLSIRLGEAYPGGVMIDYCAGQYFPTEYRKAVCAVLASALWTRYREGMSNDAIDGKSPGDRIRAHFRRQFGRGIASRYFN